MGIEGITLGIAGELIYSPPAMHEGFMPKRISHITANIAGEYIYSPPAMLYSSYEVLYNCYTIENNANYNANLALKAGKVTSESSGFVVRCSGKINLMEVMK